MDPLKKLVADRLKAPVAGPHPDAEVLSAFAENALPASERETILQHLSTCSDCRDIVFLAAPLAGHSQDVVSAPKPRPVFALRWGTLAACIVIAAVFLVSRHQAPRSEQLAKSAPQAGTSNEPHSAATDTIVAAEKTPTELREMRERAPAKVVSSSPLNGHAEPKHITAKPEGNMSFADSGEVSVNGPATLDRKVAPQPVQELPTVGRTVADLKLTSPAATPAGAASQTATGTGSGVSAGAVQGLNVGGPVQANAYSYSRNSALGAKELDAFRGSVTGTVVDASGAVIPNVKVTALGPLGTKTATSDQSGKYELRELASGNYRLKFDAPGFQETQLQQVAVVAQKPANVDVKLNPGATAETVEISAAAPVVVQQAQQEAITHNEQQQQALQELQVEAAVVKVPKSAKKNKDRLKQTAANTWDAPVWQWSVSPQGAVQRSSDLGKTWQTVTVNPNPNAIFRATSSIGPEVWAGGNGGALYHSSDSGLHWTQVVPGAGQEKLHADITQIQFVDPQHLTLTTSNSQVWTTADGGQNWARK